ncbi:uncharacterized protein LOC126614743 [Malus sylvestris]|uniref:uncharacterized protein LOC126606726 n=1 Tax=Malus sylvestris TaxID=3752 RepID=UPI0021AC4197|nr:uncharacterized protein LOC126606726 [Malus sylvestris]XP_050138355.1 uncharacterized protein LOC126614743 [Malus sylvestris]
MKMTDAAEKLNSLDVNIGEKQLVFMILQALPSKFSQLKVSYNTQDKNWDVDELIAQCVQEENRQKQERGKDAEMVNFVQSDRGKKAFNSQSGHSGTHSYLDLSLFVSRVLSHLREKRRSTGKLGAMASSSGTGTGMLFFLVLLCCMFWLVIFKL